MKFFLKNYSLLRIGGKDSKDFLNSQFTNNIYSLSSDSLQLNAYCQHQGKIISLLWTFTEDESYYLCFHSSLLEVVINRLNMFKMMSDVRIEDVSNQFFLYAGVDEQQANSFHFKSNFFLFKSKQKLDNFFEEDLWNRLCIEKGIPEIYRDTSEQFIPQALNLDINETGVSFTKGCYPGQEVVARMHYLGKPKRRLFRFTSQFEVSIGDNLNVKDSKSLKSSGQVIRVTKNDTEYQFLGVFDVGHINDKIFLNTDQTKLVYLIHE